MEVKQNFIRLFADLFTRGEMLKAEYLLKYCVPMDIEDDKEILAVKKEAFDRLEEMRSWNRDGRPGHDNPAIADVNAFPKFTLAKEKIDNLAKNRTNKLVILDIGCYTGALITELASKYECHGVDIHQDIMENMKDSDNPKFYWCSAESLLSKFRPEMFDVVMAFDVLEHCFNVDVACRQIDFVLKKGGIAIINLPRMTPGYKDEAFEHLRMFSDKQIAKMFGSRKNYKLELCKDELGRDTSFITYEKD